MITSHGTVVIESLISQSAYRLEGFNIAMECLSKLPIYQGYDPTFTQIWSVLLNHQLLAGLWCYIGTASEVSELPIDGPLPITSNSCNDL